MRAPLLAGVQHCAELALCLFSRPSVHTHTRTHTRLVVLQQQEQSCLFQAFLLLVVSLACCDVAYWPKSWLQVELSRAVSWGKFMLGFLQGKDAHRPQTFLLCGGPGDHLEEHLCNSEQRWRLCIDRWEPVAARLVPPALGIALSVSRGCNWWGCHLRGPQECFPSWRPLAYCASRALRISEVSVELQFLHFYVQRMLLGTFKRWTSVRDGPELSATTQGVLSKDWGLSQPREVTGRAVILRAMCVFCYHCSINCFRHRSRPAQRCSAYRPGLSLASGSPGWRQAVAFGYCWQSLCLSPHSLTSCWGALHCTSVFVCFFLPPPPLPAGCHNQPRFLVLVALQE